MPLSSRPTPLQVLFLLAVALLFALPDLTLLWLGHQRQKPVTLLNYGANLDFRVDETLMYANLINRGVGRWGQETYLRGKTDVNLSRPVVPLALASATHTLTGGHWNATVLLLHTVFPLLGFLLFVLLTLRLFQFDFWLSVLVVLLSTLEWGQTFLMAFDRLTFLNWGVIHPVGISSFTTGFLPQFTRFFSPGLVLPFFFLALLAFHRAVRQPTPKAIAQCGLLTALNLYVYPHQFYLLIFIFAAAVELIPPGKRRPLLPGLIVATAIPVVPFLFFCVLAKRLPHAPDIFSRIGYWDYVGILKSPLAVALALLVGIYGWAEISNGRPLRQNEGRPDRFWFLALGGGALLSLIATQYLALSHTFPQPWLLSMRLLIYLFPLVAVYGLCTLFSRRPSPRTSAAASVALLLVSGYLGVQRARTTFESYVVSPETQTFLRVLKEIPPTIVATAEPDSTVVLAAETPHFAFISYGINSNSSNAELLERVMIVSLLGGKSFSTFYERNYDRTDSEWLALGHWTFHHALQEKPLSRGEIAERYEALERLTPAELVKRYPLDKFYGALGPRYRKWFIDEGNGFYRLASAVQ